MAWGRHHDAVLITTAPKSPRDELDERQRRYLITMGIRVVAFIASILLFDGVLRVIAVALSITLPWIAVVVANAGAKPIDEQPSLYAAEPPREIDPPRDR
jgi:hypothetical protein